MAGKKHLKVVDPNIEQFIGRLTASLKNTWRQKNIDLHAIEQNIEKVTKTISGLTDKATSSLLIISAVPAYQVLLIEEICKLDFERDRRKIGNLIGKRIVDVSKIYISERNDDTINQRRMDSLAGILGVNNKLSPCIAVAMHNKKILIAANPPTSIKGKLSIITKDALLTLFRERYQLVRLFLKAIEHLVNNELDIIDTNFSASNGLEILHYLNVLDEILDKISPKIKELCTLYAKELSGENSEAGAKDNHRRLDKLAQHYLLGIFSIGKIGFTEEEREALSCGEVYAFTNSSTEGANHAEQILAHHIASLEENNRSATPAKPIHIGINKLCCRSCADVLERPRYKDLVTYRGTHGVVYAKVLDIDNNTQHAFEPTKAIKDKKFLCASQSESDTFFSYISDDEYEVEVEFELDEEYREKPEVTLAKTIQNATSTFNSEATLTINNPEIVNSTFSPISAKIKILGKPLFHCSFFSNSRPDSATSTMTTVTSTCG